MGTKRTKRSRFSTSGKKHFSLTDDLQTICHEGIDRKGLKNYGLVAPEKATEDEPIPIYDHREFKTPQDVADLFGDELEDEEAILTEAIDEKIEMVRKGYIVLPFAGVEPKLKLPCRVVKMVKRVIHPERKSAMTAACFNAKTGLLICVY